MTNIFLYRNYLINHHQIILDRHHRWFSPHRDRLRIRRRFHALQLGQYIFDVSQIHLPSFQFVIAFPSPSCRLSHTAHDARRRVAAVSASSTAAYKFYRLHYYSLGTGSGFSSALNNTSILLFLTRTSTFSLSFILSTLRGRRERILGLLSRLLSLIDLILSKLRAARLNARVAICAWAGVPPDFWYCLEVWLHILPSLPWMSLLDNALLPKSMHFALRMNMLGQQWLPVTEMPHNILRDYFSCYCF